MNTRADTTPHRPKVLVLDDSETILEVTQEVLEEGGYAVVTVSSSALLPSIWNHEKPDLALIDVSMPVMDGNSVVELMRRSSLHRCPLVLHSDQPEAKLKELVRACGATGYLRKTSDGASLLRQVAAFLRPSGAPQPAAVEVPLVFVVDSDPGSRGALEAALKQCGAEPVALEAGEPCLAELRRRRPALVVVRLDQRPVSGDDCVKAIRENRGFSDVPIVMTSTAATTVEVMRAWRAGADDFMTLPVAPELLERKLTAARAAALAEPSPSASEAPRAVLLADHSAFYRSRLGRMLECSGYRMLYARSAEEALASSTRHGRNLAAVLVDLALPGAKAAELARALERQGHALVMGLDAAPNGAEAAEVARITSVAVADKNGPCELIVGRLNAALRRADQLMVAERAPFFSRVDFRRGADAAWSSGFSYDLSGNGIFITTLTPEPPGAAIELRITFPGRESAVCAGKVAWANPLAGRSVYSYMVGMGVQLTTMDEATAKTVSQYTAKVRGAGGRAA